MAGYDLASSAITRLSFAQLAKTALIRTDVRTRKNHVKERRSMAGLGAKPENKVLAQPSWPDEVYRVLKQAGVVQVGMVPDAGHIRLIRAFEADPETRLVTLTTEEEGVAMLAGAWLGGQRGVLLLQSSGVGNCINMLSLPAILRAPLLMLVTMRGEWGEFNPWQVPMSAATQISLQAIGVRVMRADTPD